MRYSVCVDALYSGQETIKSMEEVKKLGYDTIEFWQWWDKDIPAIKRQCKTLGMTVSTFCTKFTSLVDPTQHGSYLSGLEESLVVAKELGVTRLITQVGNDTGAPRIEQHQHLIDGLKKCVPLLEEYGVTLMVEPLNTRIDHEGYYLTESNEAYEVIKAVGSPYVSILFDIYHQYVMKEEIIENIQNNIGYISHFHAADYPGRHELNHGEIDYTRIFDAIKQTNYKGYVGLEYFPQDSPEIGLSLVYSENNDIEKR